MRTILTFLFCLIVNQALAAVALDGTPKTGLISGAAASSVVSAAFTNTNATAVLEVAVNTSNGSAVTVSSIACGAVNPTLRKRVNNVGANFNHASLELWSAVLSSALTGQTCTATLSGTSNAATILVWAVSGENTGTPFDANGALPASNTNLTASSTAPTVTVSTTNANTMLEICAGTIGTPLNGGSAPTLPTGFTTVGFANGFSGSPNFFNGDIACAYEVVSSTQSSTAITYGTATTEWQTIGDAVQQSGGGATLAPQRAAVGVGQ